jgi:hypothetical protein
MALFKRNPVDALAKQRALLAADEAKITELLRTRAAVLLESESVSEVEELDQRIAALLRAVRIHADRIAALEVQVRAEAAERREAARADAIRLIQKRLSAREKIAEELEASIKRTGDLFFQLIQSESGAPLWPFGGPVPRAIVDADSVRRETAFSMFSAGRPIGGRTVFPGPSNIGLGVSGVHAIGIAPVVANQSSALLSLLREMPIGDGDAAGDKNAPPENVPEPHGLSELATS